jgi:hypothetical protein
MPSGPKKIILIRSGRYEYSEIDLAGAVQIVGPNNTGKTTLINTLQFLYLDDRRHMDFGSYTADQTREFYFPGQFSYVLFECLGVDGLCVLGWRGQSKTAGGEPERFCYLGAYDEADFLDEKQQVREPRDVNSRLALKQYRVIKSAQEHRELLLPPAYSQSRGFGIVSLRDGDKYHHFRESLKCLLTLSAISQEQMRDRLLMLADIPPDRTALDIRSLFGEDYDGIRQRRERLLRFKKNQDLVRRLVTAHASRQSLRDALMYRWSDLRIRRQAFEQDHDLKLQNHRAEMASQSRKAQVLRAELQDRRQYLNHLAEQRGALKSQTEALAAQGKDFTTFVEDLERAAIANLKGQVRTIENQLSHAESESREKARHKVGHYTDLVSQKRQTIERFDHLAVSFLRKHFSDAELNSVFRLLNPDLLELPVDPAGATIKRQQELLAVLRQVLGSIKDGCYEDSNISIRFGAHEFPLAGLEDVEAARAHLKDYQETLAHWQSVLQAIEQRESLQAKSTALRQDLEKQERRLFAYEEFQKKKALEPQLLAELKTISSSFDAVQEKITSLEAQIRAAEKAEEHAQAAIRNQEDAYSQVINRFALCMFPEFNATAREVEIPNDFDAAIAVYLRDQESERKLSDDTSRLLSEVERWFGEEFRGADEIESIRLLQGELEALPDKEEALSRDWNAHIHALKATFDRVLRELNEIHSAKDDLNRHFGRVQVSNLKSVRMEVIEQGDLVTWIRRLSAFEPGGLFDADPERESALVNFRTKLQNNPILRFADLFTLGVTVLGPDGRKHTYHDFRQIESHGTTVAIKVLFNLLVLKSQLRRDDCQVPFFLDEIQILDPGNRHAILETARKLGFLAITAAPEAVSEVDALYFLQPRKGWIVLRNKHRLGVRMSRETSDAPAAVANEAAALDVGK